MKKRHVIAIILSMGFVIFISIGVMLYAFSLQIKAHADLDKVKQLYEKCIAEKK